MEVKFTVFEKCIIKKWFMVIKNLFHMIPRLHTNTISYTLSKTLYYLLYENDALVSVILLICAVLYFIRYFQTNNFWIGW